MLAFALSPNFGPSPFGPSIHSDAIARDLCTTGHSKFAGVSVLHRAIDPMRGRGGRLAYGTAAWVEGHAAECWQVECFASPDGGHAVETYLYCHRESDFYDVAIRFTGAEWELARKTKETRQ